MTQSYRGFYVTSRTWYAESLRKILEPYTFEVMFGIYDDDGATDGEMAMRWRKMVDVAVPQLQVFDDAFIALVSFGDLLEELAKRNDKNMTPDEFITILSMCGFKDLTEYEVPQ